MTKSKIQNKFKIQITNTKTKVLLFGICGLYLFCHLCFVLCHFAYAQEIKQPNVAGIFYPDNAKDLSEMIDDFLNRIEPKTSLEKIFALICPHAGLGYSGQTASFAYKLIKDKSYKTVVIIGPSHYYGFMGVSVYPEGFFRTPLGDLEIDKEFTQKILNKDKEISFIPQAFSKEHSIEVQLIFLQKVLKDSSATKNDESAKHYGWKIVPIVTGDCSLSTCQKLAQLLKEVIDAGEDVLVVASSDMYHGYDYEACKKIDEKTLDYLKKMDAEGLYYGLREERLQLCGGWAVVVTLLLAKELGYQDLEVLNYTNSAEVTGKKIKGLWTVGYTSCAIGAKKDLSLEKKGEEAMLDKKQRKRLLEIARQSIQTYLETGKKLEVTETDPVLRKEMGAFVTLHKKGQLRGCIGNLVGNQPLYLTVRDMAVEAAVADPRFAPLELSELKDIEIEISALSPLEKIDSVDKIKLGTHGVLVRKGFQSGVFLPQVATETGWSKEEFLSYLCAHKAGLSPDAWKDKTTEIYIFTAEVFSEKED